jgi:hypothetical protein
MICPFCPKWRDLPAESSYHYLPTNLSRWDFSTFMGVADLVFYFPLASRKQFGAASPGSVTTVNIQRVQGTTSSQPF